MRTNRSSSGGSAALLLGLVFILGILPLVIASDYIQHLIVVAMMYAVVASNWDLTLGFAGIFNFAHIALFAVGAYAAGVLSKIFGISPWLCIPAGAFTSALAAMIVALPVLRVKGIYVCLVTFAFGQLCLHLVLTGSDYTGGSHGLVMIPSIKLGGYSFAEHGKLAYYYLALAMLVASTFFLVRLVTSPLGLSIVALRDFEELAVSRGVGLARQRLLTMVSSAIFTGGIGAVYAFYLGSVSAELFGFGYLTTVLSMILFGGTATIFGPILGAFVLTFVSEFMVSFGPWRFLIIASLIILVILLYPDGIFAAVKSIFRRRVRMGRGGRVRNAEAKSDNKFNSL
jgi:branched-chain amino acid transport system permease protein